MCEACSAFVRNATYDPTNTTPIRAKFTKDLEVRFAQLLLVIRSSIIKQDCFGLRVQNVAPQETLPKQFAFSRTDKKVEGFMDWLAVQEARGLLARVEAPQIGEALDAAWTNTYVLSAYSQGLLHAQEQLEQAGIRPAGGFMPLEAALVLPVHADRLGALYTRTFSELRGITDAMDQQISRTLAEGMLRGLNPEAIAKEVTAKVKGVGLARARTLARTEIIRAHHLANIQEYRNAGLFNVRVRAEWLTAGDLRVCPECQSLNHRIFTLAQIEPMIPVHPNCRCVALPVV